MRLGGNDGLHGWVRCPAAEAVGHAHVISLAFFELPRHGVQHHLLLKRAVVVEDAAQNGLWRQARLIGIGRDDVDVVGFSRRERAAGRLVGIGQKDIGPGIDGGKRGLLGLGGVIPGVDVGPAVFDASGWRSERRE